MKTTCIDELMDIDQLNIPIDQNKDYRLYSTLIIDQLKYLIVADLHVGFQWEFSLQGVEVPDSISADVISELYAAIDNEKPAHIIFLGDIEHSWAQTYSSLPINYRFSMYRKRKLKLLAELFTELHNRNIQVTVVKGNHDISLDNFPDVPHYSEFELSLPESSIVFCHGHRLPENLHAQEYFFAHIHPCIQLFDRAGVPYHLPVFLYGELTSPQWLSLLHGGSKRRKYAAPDPLITNPVHLKIIPPFNRHLAMMSGNFVNVKKNRRKYSSDTFLTRFLNSVNFEVFLPNGKFLGFLKDLSE